MTSAAHGSTVWLFIKAYEWPVIIVKVDLRGPEGFVGGAGIVDGGGRADLGVQEGWVG